MTEPALTEVAFHSGLPDRQAYACRLLRKAQRQGVRVIVTGSADELARLDVALWVFEQEEFVPHLRLRGGAQVLPRMQRTPVWLIEELELAVLLEACDAGVLVNLGPEGVTEAPRFGRVIELVGSSEAERQSGRERWRAHRAAGLAPSNLLYSTGAALAVATAPAEAEGEAEGEAAQVAPPPS